MSDTWIIIASVALVAVGIAGLMASRKPKSEPPKPDKAPEKPPQPTTAHDSAETSKLLPMHVYYGSQTGTAEGFSKQISNDAKRHGFKATVVDLENFDVDTFVGTAGNDSASGHPHVAVFIMATYGEGDPTDNAVAFTKWLKNASHPPDLLHGLKYVVFGLGNRQYEHYNAMGRLVNQRLGEMGATPVYRYGEGDDDGTLEEDFDGWKADMWNGIKADLGLLEGSAAGGHGGPSDDLAIELPPMPWRVHWIATPDNPDATATAAIEACRAKLADKTIDADQVSKHYFTSKPVKVVVNDELRQRPSVGNSTRHIELDLSGTGLHYGTADDLAVLPHNNDHTVDVLAKWLGFDKEMDRWFTLELSPDAEEKPKTLFPTPCTVRTALTTYVDICGMPRKQLLSYFAVLASNSSEKRRLQILASREGKEEYNKWAVEQERAIWEVFQDFPSVKPTFEQFIQLLPPLHPRWYTIASSSVAHPNTVHLAVSVIHTAKKGAKGRVLAGVCSNYLETAAVGSVVRCDLRASNFKLPADASKPVILVGPGTGLAPMRAFLQERRFQQQQGQVLGECALYFGCRRRDEDYIYRDELHEYSQDGTITQLITAFSREQQEKVYVQHRLREHGRDVWRMLHEEGGSMFVCGATQMGDDVKHAVVDIAVEHGGMTKEAAAQWLKDIHDRYIVELW